MFARPIILAVAFLYANYARIYMRISRWVTVAKCSYRLHFRFYSAEALRFITPLPPMQRSIRQFPATLVQLSSGDVSHKSAATNQLLSIDIWTFAIPFWPPKVGVIIPNWRGCPTHRTIHFFSWSCDSSWEFPSLPFPLFFLPFFIYLFFFSNRFFFLF